MYVSNTLVTVNINSNFLVSHIGFFFFAGRTFTFHFTPNTFSSFQISCVKHTRAPLKMKYKYFKCCYFFICPDEQHCGQPDVSSCFFKQWKKINKLYTWIAEHDVSSHSEYLAVSAWYIHLLAGFLECVSKCDGRKRSRC